MKTSSLISRILTSVRSLSRRKKISLAVCLCLGLGLFILALPARRTDSDRRLSRISKQIDTVRSALGENHPLTVLAHARWTQALLEEDWTKVTDSLARHGRLGQESLGARLGLLERLVSQESNGMDATQLRATTEMALALVADEKARGWIHYWTLRHCGELSIQLLKRNENDLAQKLARCAWDGFQWAKTTPTWSQCKDDYESTYRVFKNSLHEAGLGIGWEEGSQTTAAQTGAAVPSHAPHPYSAGERTAYSPSEAPPAKPAAAATPVANPNAFPKDKACERVQVCKTLQHDAPLVLGQRRAELCLVYVEYLSDPNQVSPPPPGPCHLMKSAYQKENSCYQIVGTYAVTNDGTIWRKNDLGLDMDRKDKEIGIERAPRPAWIRDEEYLRQIPTNRAGSPGGNGGVMPGGGASPVEGECRVCKGMGNMSRVVMENVDGYRSRSATEIHELEKRKSERCTNCNGTGKVRR